MLYMGSITVNFSEKEKELEKKIKENAKKENRNLGNYVKTVLKNYLNFSKSNQEENLICNSSSIKNKNILERL